MVLEALLLECGGLSRISGGRSTTSSPTLHARSHSLCSIVPAHIDTSSLQTLRFTDSYELKEGFVTDTPKKKYHFLHMG